MKIGCVKKIVAVGHAERRALVHISAVSAHGDKSRPLSCRKGNAVVTFGHD
jgi:hypothetical protein